MTPVDAVRRYPELVAGLLVIAGLAWWWTVVRMAGMDAGPGTDLGTLGWFAGSWVSMMAAMMLPSIVPTLTAYATGIRGRAPSSSLLFVAGYLLAWTAAGLCAYGLFELGRQLLGSELAWHRAGRWVAGGVLACAAAYELIPLKRVCLERCRGRLGASAVPGRHDWRAALAGLAIGILAAPHDVPGLVVPGSGGAHAMMEMMG